MTEESNCEEEQDADGLLTVSYFDLTGAEASAEGTMQKCHPDVIGPTEMRSASDSARVDPVGPLGLTPQAS